MTVAGLVGVVGLLHSQAPAAVACVGGILYEDAVREASGAVVGRVVAIARDPVGFDYVATVRMERPYGIAATGVFRHRANPGRGPGARWVAPTVAAIGGLLLFLLASSRRRRSARA